MSGPHCRWKQIASWDFLSRLGPCARFVTSAGDLAPRLQADLAHKVDCLSYDPCRVGL
jgi:hypothetical protein